jgi:hypothetical protein
MKRYIKTLVCSLLTLVTCIASGQLVRAQSSYGASLLKSYQNQNSARRYSVRSVQNQLAGQSVSSSGVLGVNRQSYSNLFSSSSPRSKPFSSLQRGPTVSSYLSLSSSFNGVSDYYNIVRPQREQERANQQQQRQMYANQHRLNQIAASGPYELQGDENLAPTGHTTTYMYLGNFGTTGNYYPPVMGLDKQQP